MENGSSKYDKLWNPSPTKQESSDNSTENRFDHYFNQPNVVSDEKETGIPEWMQLAIEGAAGLGLSKFQKAGYKAGTIPSVIYNMESALGSKTPLMLSQQGTAIERAERVKQLEDWAKRLGNDKAIDMFLPKSPVAPTEPPNLFKPIPMGGVGTETYALKANATPVQAREAASMQDVQQRVIPSNDIAIENLRSGIGKGYQMYDDGSGNMVAMTPEQAQEMNEQRAAAFRSQTDQAKAIQDKAQQQLRQQQARAAANVARTKPVAEAASATHAGTVAETQAIRQSLATEMASLPPALRQAFESSGRFIGPVGRALGKYLGPVAAAGAPFAMAQGLKTMEGPELTDKLRGVAEVGGGAGGLMTLAPWLARAGLIAPEIGAGLAATGGVLAIPGLAYALHDLYKAHPPASQDQAVGYEVAPLQ
jgi:hypothetical protein